jgi:hypothetical protein
MVYFVDSYIGNFRPYERNTLYLSLKFRLYLKNTVFNLMKCYNLTLVIKTETDLI